LEDLILSNPDVAQTDALADVPCAERPKHIAIIMDGNGRWAREQGLPRIEGHRRGVNAVRTATEQCAQLGIEHLTLYCFSSENWKRPQAELDALMSLLEQFMIEERSEILRENIRLTVIGRREGMPESVLRETDKTVAMSCEHTGLHLCLAINYGARGELADAMRSVATEVRKGNLNPEDITEDTIADALYTAGTPDPDLLIRTAGEMRISNYLLWQISYAELWITQRHWPEFGPADLHQAIRDFAARDRRFGGLNV